MRVSAFCALSLSLILACGDDDETDPDTGPLPDGGMVDAMDVDAEREAFCNPPELVWGVERIDMVNGIMRDSYLSVDRDFCEDITISLSASTEGIVDFVDTVTIPARTSRADVIFTALAEGETTITATYTDLPGTPDEMTFTSTLDVRVQDTTVPTCTGTASALVAPGEDIRLDDDLTGLTIPEGAARDDQYHVDPLDISVDCADDQIPEGYVALGPAITFGPVHARLNRELPFTVPVKLALLPENARRGNVEFAYSGPGVTEARAIPVASPDFETNPGYVTFYTSRFGTYQPIARENGPQLRERTFTFRGITGVSMGSGGAALIGMHNPDRFDFLGPLGGPVDWIHLLHYIRTWHIGGFCTEQERMDDPEGCAGPARTDRTPPATDLRYEVAQDFEHWRYEDEWRGHGGTFDRQEYMRLFRDLARMYGNPNTTATLDPTGANVLPPGIPDSDRERTDADRCENPVVIPPCEPDGEGGCEPGTGFFDEEYNPVGQHPAITFCDGAEVTVDGERDHGVWDPSVQPQPNPIEVALSIDLDDNGIRDPGEPIIRQGRENFLDCGIDQVCNADEPGYDPITNPDPNEDDYDFQFNPTGTENNWLRDYVGDPVAGCESPVANPIPGEGEIFFDDGMDAVPGTAQLDEGGFDNGEGDDCWTQARGVAHMLANNPRSFVLTADEDTLRDLDFFSDGGIRDLFNFASNQNHLAGSFAARGLPLTLFNSHAALTYDGLFLDEDLRFNNVDWRETGKYVHIRYGNVDASEGALAQGDGQHVGTPNQVLNRIISVMAWMSQRWPGGDRRRVIDRICPEISPGCENMNQFAIDFTSPTTGRTGPAAIILPPGYFDEEYQDVEYPVVYLLHGYGQDPTDLVATGIIIWNFMTARTIPEAQRFQKMIFVFPDGRCRGDECVKGTFYANAPEGTPDGAQMETFMLDLMDYMDANFRTKRSETHMVYE